MNTLISPIFTKNILDLENLTKQCMQLDLCIHKQHLYFHNEDSHFWEQISRQDESLAIRRHIVADCQASISAHQIEEVILRLKSCPQLQHDFDLIRNPLQFNLKNGVFDLRDNKLLEYTTDSFFTYCLDFSYHPSLRTDSKNTHWQHFLSTSFSSSDIGLKERLLYEIIGYVISDLTAAKKAFFFIGPPNCGKSMLLNLIKEIVGSSSTSNIPFSALGHRFNTAGLYGKKVNLCSEVSCKKINNADIFKSIVGCDFIQAEEKGQKPFFFKCQCKLLTAGNILPRFRFEDGTASLSDRIQILSFDNSVASDHQAKNLGEALYNERDYIFSRSLDSLNGLIARNYQFTSIPSQEQSLFDYRDSFNSFDNFIADACFLTSNERIHKATLWDEFQKYCYDNGYELCIDKSIFFAKVAALQGVSSGKFRLHGQPLAGFIGISLKVYTPFENPIDNTEGRQ